MDEKVILENIRNGDRTQLAVIYREYRSEFIAWITSKFQCSRDEARDIYQVSIIAFYENIASNKLQSLSSSVKTYLFAIGKNKFLEYRKSDSRFDYISDGNGYELEEVVSWEKQEKEMRLQIAERCLEKLGDPCKSLLELYYFHGMSMEEIAGKLSYKNPNTSKNLKYKCLIRLRNLFEKEMKKMEAMSEEE